MDNPQLAKHLYCRHFLEAHFPYDHHRDRRRRIYWQQFRSGLARWL
jgi:hypothetical protein